MAIQTCCWMLVLSRLVGSNVVLLFLGSVLDTCWLTRAHRLSVECLLPKDTPLHIDLSNTIDACGPDLDQLGLISRICLAFVKT